MKKIVAILAVSAFIVGSIPVTNVSANNDDAVAAIAGIIALGVIGAAVGKHQHQQGYEDYRPHPQLHSDENAVGTCMHHTEKLV